MQRQTNPTTHNTSVQPCGYQTLMWYCPWCGHMRVLQRTLIGMQPNITQRNVSMTNCVNRSCSLTTVARTTNALSAIGTLPDNRGPRHGRGLLAAPKVGKAAVDDRRCAQAIDESHVLYASKCTRVHNTIANAIAWPVQMGRASVTSTIQSKRQSAPSP